MKKLVLILPLLLAAVGFGQELLVNGNFEQDLSVGWTVDTGGYGYRTISRIYDPGPDNHYAMDSIYQGAGWSRLEQTVDVPGPALVLTFRAKFDIGGGSSACWPVAAVVASYEDASGNTLGETRYYYHNSYCTWAPSPTLSLVEVSNSDWNQYTLDVAEELATNLPGVNAGDVAKVEVALYDTTTGG